MKLDKIKFGYICTTIQIWLSERKQLLSTFDIEELDRLIDIEVQEKYRINPDRLEDLLRLIVNNTGTATKIEAIKVFRELTGAGLKESKDAVERHLVDKRVQNDN